MRICAFSIIFFLVSGALHAQRNKIDSIQTILAHEKEDTTKVNHFIALSVLYVYDGDYDSATLAANSALLLSRRLNFKKGIAQSCNNLGGFNQEQGYYDIAIGYHATAIKAKQALRDSIGLAGSYNNLGLIYMYRENYDSSLYYYLLSVSIKERKKDSLNMVISYNNLGLLYSSQKDFPKALEYFNKGLVICIAQAKTGKNVSRYLATVYLNMGIVYYKQGKNSLAMEHYRKSLTYYINIESNSGQSYCYNNIGNIYADQSDSAYSRKDSLSGKHLYLLAMENYDLSIEMKKEDGDRPGLIVSYLNLADFNRTTKQYKQAIKYGEMALRSANECESPTGIKNAYYVLSNIYFDLKDYALASQNYSQYLAYNNQDTIVNDQSLNLAKALRKSIPPDSQKALLHDSIEQLKQGGNEGKQVQSKNVIAGLLLVGILVGLVIVFVIIRRRKKSVAQKQIELTVYNRLFELIDVETNSTTYFSGQRFIDLVREVEPDFPDYTLFITQRNLEGKSTNRRFYFYDILTSLSPTSRMGVINRVLDIVRPHTDQDVETIDELLGHKPTTTDASVIETTPGGEESPIVFISYSWDTEEHKQWVLNLADRMSANGIDVILDSYYLRPGKNVPHFVEDSIAKAHKVIIIFTPNYKLKADKREGGVGREYSIINAGLYNAQVTNEKIIPVLRAGSAEESIPVFMRQFIHLDARKDENFKNTYIDLIREIYGQPAIDRP
ncbi:MAG TPA: tetratricopeptide repeat protein, partial [Bacteroidia bacterium]|nr:tetratricopeptide repeat protein [Bacteroidia bacterium]